MFFGTPCTICKYSKIIKLGGRGIWKNKSISHQDQSSQTILTAHALNILANLYSLDSGLSIILHYGKSFEF